VFALQCCCFYRCAFGRHLLLFDKTESTRSGEIIKGHQNSFYQSIYMYELSSLLSSPIFITWLFPYLAFFCCDVFDVRHACANRSARAPHTCLPQIDPAEMVPLNSLDTSGAPHEEDLVLHETGPVALCLRSMSETDHNTSDSALNEALRVGQAPSENAAWEPTVISLEVADPSRRQ